MNPDKHVMFFAIGFETTAPSTALTLMRAKAKGIRNFSVFCNHDYHSGHPRDPRFSGHAVDFLGPGHVSTVVGLRPYRFVPEVYGKPMVVAGFEPLDVLQSIVMLLRQLNANEQKVENQYKRVVPWEGNRAALKAMAETFELRPYFEWRGLGFISQSALRIRDSYAEWDAERRFNVPGVQVTDPRLRSAGSLEGRAEAGAVQAVWKECTPEHPVGALMVSSEGSCAAYYKYEHRKNRELVNVS
jgi:hydrogenase expression/formation protein HypD